MISTCCSFNILIIRWALTLDPPDGQNPVLDIGGSQRKGAGSVFHGGGSQITGGGSESWGGDLRSDGIPNLTPGFMTIVNSAHWLHCAILRHINVLKALIIVIKIIIMMMMTMMIFTCGLSAEDQDRLCTPTLIHIRGYEDYLLPSLFITIIISVIIYLFFCS